MNSILPRFERILVAASEADIRSDPTLSGRLVLESAGRLQVSYAPFDHMNLNARIVLVGITPGRQQAINALVEASRRLKGGASVEEADRAAKKTASFSGLMRANLVDTLDYIGIARWLRLGSCSELFQTYSDLIHYTSALRFPVFVSGRNYSGTPSIGSSTLLARMVARYLAAEARSLPSAVWVPLGPCAASALQMLAAERVLDRAKVLDGLPHPSGANSERIAYFLGRKERKALSRMTNAAGLDAARMAVLRQVALLS